MNVRSRDGVMPLAVKVEMPRQASDTVHGSIVRHPAFKETRAISCGALAISLQDF
jgi:hypothetical protein